MMASKEPASAPARRRFDAVWLLPLLAAVAVGWMIFDTQIRKGPVVRIQFESVVGIVAGKTPVRFNGVQIGTVRSVDADPENGLAVVECQLDNTAEPFALSGARYWIQYPQIGLDGVESLDTLISGPYIAAYPGDGDATADFVGELKRPPNVTREGDLRVSLRASSVDSIRRDSPVLFRGMEVGYVDEIALDGSAGAILVAVVIRSEFSALVRAASYFWEVSGYEVNASLTGGFQIESSSLRSIINGGIAFENTDGGAPIAPAPDRIFTLHANERVQAGPRIPIEISFRSAELIVPGTTLLRHRGVEVGVVTGVDLADGLESVTVSASLYEPYADLATEGSFFWLVKPEIDISGVRGLDAIGGGSYIAIRAGGGEPSTSFQGRRNRPNRPESGPGLDLVLESVAGYNVTEGSPIFYKQVVVGQVTAVDVSRDGGGIRIYANIDPRYSPLVRQDSVFWSVGGVSVSAGLASFNVEFETLGSVLLGALAFATPPQGEGSTELSDGAVFTIQTSENSRWANWTPNIDLGEDY